jgi:hypothetical protein
MHMRSYRAVPLALAAAFSLALPAAAHAADGGGTAYLFTPAPVTGDGYTGQTCGLQSIADPTAEENTQTGVLTTPAWAVPGASNINVRCEIQVDGETVVTSTASGVSAVAPGLSTASFHLPLDSSLSVCVTATWGATDVTVLGVHVISAPAGSYGPVCVL